MELYSLLGITPGLTAVIGSGGKSTLLQVLSEELPGRVLLCTSTHFMGYPHLPTVLDPTPEQLREALSRDRVVCAARRSAERKLCACGLPYTLLRELADYVLLEADGSRHLPLKAHAAHEPVIPPLCDKTVCVVGLSGLGTPISQSVHRPEIFCALTDSTPQEIVTPAMAAQALLQEHLSDTFFLNQAETTMHAAQALAEPLTAAGCTVVAGSLREKRYQRL